MVFLTKTNKKQHNFYVDTYLNSHSRILLYVVSPGVTSLTIAMCHRPHPVSASSVSEKGAECSTHTVYPDQMPANQLVPQNPNVWNLGLGNKSRLSQRLFLLNVNVQSLPKVNWTTTDQTYIESWISVIIFSFFWRHRLQPRNLHFRRETSYSQERPTQDQHQPWQKMLRMKVRKLLFDNNMWRFLCILFTVVFLVLITWS